MLSATAISLCSANDSFYDDPIKRFWYPIHKYKERGVEFSSQLAAEDPVVSLRFIGQAGSLLNCTYSIVNETLDCLR
jgi:hypothetical protein